MGAAPINMGKKAKKDDSAAAAAAFRAALGLPANPEQDDDDDDDDLFDEEAARKHEVTWARGSIGNSDDDDDDDDDSIEDSDHLDSDDEAVNDQVQAAPKRKKKTAVKEDESPGADWVVGDSVTVGGRAAVVVRDMRPKHNRATVIWSDDKVEERKIDADTIQLSTRSTKKRK